MTLTRNNVNDPLSPDARAVADAFWRACLGQPQTFKSDLLAVAAALRTVVHRAGFDDQERWLVSANDLLDIAEEFEKVGNENDD